MSKSKHNFSPKTASFTGTSLSMPKASKTPLVRQSGHLVDNKLKYRNPNKQLNIFDQLDPDLKGEVESKDIKFEGIRLSASEDRLINALTVLLKKKSEHKDTTSHDYYQGNHAGKTMIWVNDSIATPTLRIKPSDIYKSYLGKDDYSEKKLKKLIRPSTL